MRLDKKSFLGGLIFISTCPLAAHATDMFGNPTDIGSPGSFEVQVGGGRATDLSLDEKATTVTTQIGGASQSFSLSADSITIKREQVFVGLSYAFGSTMALFGRIDTAKDSGQPSKSGELGIKISPEIQATGMRLGLMLRAQKVSERIDEQFVVQYPYNWIDDGTNIYAFWDPVNATEQINYTRTDVFFGASKSFGAIRPYGGLCLTRISGTHSIAVDEVMLTYSSPSAGGPTTSSNRRVRVDATADISGSRYVSAVLGVSFGYSDDINMTAEVQAGVQRAYLVSGSIRF